MHEMDVVNARVVTPDEVLDGATVSLRGGRIEAATVGAARGVSPSGEVYDAGGRTLVPGFIDLHNHGALGADFMDGDAEAMRRVRRFLAGRGVTGYLATTTSSTAETLAESMDFARELMAAGPDGAQVLGMHFEGPYLNEALCGMHPSGHCRPPDPAEYGEWFDSGVVRRMTASLELPPTPSA